ADRIDFSDAATQSIGHALEQCVTDRVSEGIVDALEMVEIDVQNRQALTAVSTGECLIKLFAEHQTIGQAGERVVMCQSRNQRSISLAFFFCAPPLGDVLMRGHPTATRHRSTHHVNGAAICGLHRLARRLFESDSGQKFGTVLLRVTRKGSGFLAMINYFPEGEAGLDHLGRQSVHLDITLIAEHKSRYRIEHAETTR